MRTILLAVLLLLLAACGADERQVGLCRDILHAVAPEPISELAVEGDLGTVEIRFRSPDSARDEVGETLVCRFGGGTLSPERLSLLSVERNGSALSDVQMVLLRRAFGLVTPTEVLPPSEEEGRVTPMRQAAYLLQQLVNGLVLGAVIALVALGYSLVYGITGTIQFAYGEVFMIGAYLGVIFFTTMGVADIALSPLLLLLILPAAAGLTALYGWAMERSIYRPLRFSPPLPALIAAIGLAIALREYVRIAQSGRAKWLPNLFPGRIALFDGEGFIVFLGQTQLAILVLALALSIALFWCVARSPWGRAQRACADDAALLGVDVDRTVALTFALGAALAAIAGLAVALYYGEADFAMGFLFGFKALTAALLGGFGSLPGAFLGGLVLGLFEALWSAYFGLAYKDAAIFTLLVLILIFRPQGLLAPARS